MSAAVDVPNDELRHLNNPINFCILAEDMLVQSTLWRVENTECGEIFADRERGVESGLECLDILNNNSWEISQTQEFFNQVGVYVSDLPQYMDSNMERYTRKFALALEKLDTTILDRNIYLKHFYKTACKISELECSDATVEIAKNNSLKYTLLFPENRMLMISSGINNESEDVVFSFFINRELISTNAMELTGFVEGFKKFLKS